MAVETYLHWHQKLSSLAPMLIERCLWLRLPKFQSPFCVTSAGGHLMRETQLSKNVRQFEILPEAVAEILKSATDF